MSKRLFRHQKITVAVTGIGTFPISDLVDQTFKNVIGISVQPTVPAAMLGSTFSQPLQIGGEIVFDEGYEPKMLYAGDEVSPAEKFYMFKKPYKAEGNPFKTTYNCVVATAHNLNIYLWLTNDDDTATKA